jgi:DNA-binding transcriptional regulator YiaG
MSTRIPKAKKKWKYLTPKQRSKLKTARAKWRRQHPSEDHLAFAKECVALRKSLNLSQEQFAHQLEVTKTTVSRWERGSGHLPEGKNREAFDYLKKLNEEPDEHTTSI